MKNNLLIPSFVIALAVIFSTLILRSTFREQLASKQTLKVTGSADLSFRSDLGFLRGSIAASSPQLAVAFQDLQRQIPIFKAALEEYGIKTETLKFFPASRSSQMRYDKNGNSTGEVMRWNYYQRFEIRSSDVELIERLSVNLAKLVEKKVYLNIDSPEFLFTGLSEKKVEVQALAAKNAMERAKQIALATSSKLGAMRGARMGVLQITPLHSTTVSDYGMNDTTAIDKKITAVVSAQFSISSQS